MSKLIWAGGETLAAHTGNPADHVVVPKPFCDRVTARLDHELALAPMDADRDSLRELRRWFHEYGEGLPLGYTCWQLPPIGLTWTEADYEEYDTQASAKTLALADALQGVLERWENCWEEDRPKIQAVIRGIRDVANTPQFMLTIY